MQRPTPLILDRRGLLVAGAAFSVSGLVPSAGAEAIDVVARLRELEQGANGRLGVCILDTARGTAIGWRQHERFTHASSFKMSLAAMLLAKGDAGRIDLGEVLHWTKRDMLSFSPITQANLEKGLSVRGLARAALVMSDNTAANVLMRRFGGPAELTRYWRSIGDAVSRLDRYEPELNFTPPGTQLDTTTPAAMASTIAALVHGNALKPRSRATLREWMQQVKTGKDRLRAGFPSDWIAGDKTGTSDTSLVDLAFGGPTGRPPLVVAAYVAPGKGNAPLDADPIAVLAKVGRIAAATLPNS